MSAGQMVESQEGRLASITSNFTELVSEKVLEPTLGVLQTGQRLGNKMLALVGISAAAAAGGGLLLVPESASAHATRNIYHVRIPNLYTSTSPETIIDMLQTDLVPQQGLVASAASVTSNTLRAEGDCANGSLFSVWNDSGASLDRIKCDGEQITTTEVSGSDTEGRFQNELQKVGALLINSIPGQSIDLKQAASSLSVTPNAAQEIFACPPPSPKEPYPYIKNVNIDQASKASLVFCPSSEKISMTPTDTYSARFAEVFNEFKADPLRNEKWGGDSYKYDMFLQCPNLPLEASPNIAFSYSRRSGARAVFESLSPIKYCDRVGQFTSEIRAQVKRPRDKHYRQFGKSVLHVDGLREVLVFGYGGNYMPNSYERVHVALPETKVACRPSHQHLQIRLKLKEHFQGMSSQEFVHATSGPTDGMPNGTKTYYSRLRTAC